jgi:hypothetical protein
MVGKCSHQASFLWLLILLLTRKVGSALFEIGSETVIAVFAVFFRKMQQARNFTLFPESYRQQEHPNIWTAELCDALCYLYRCESEDAAPDRAADAIERNQSPPSAF